MELQLQERMAAKVNELQQAHAARAQLENQLKGVRVHILRLEGSLNMLRELGAPLPPGVVDELQPAHAAQAQLQQALTDNEPIAAQPSEPEEAADAAEEGHEQRDP